MFYIGDRVYFKDANDESQDGEIIDIDRDDNSAFVRYEINASDSVCGTMSRYIWMSLVKLKYSGVLHPDMVKDGYILDPTWRILPDGSLRLMEVSLIPAPKENSNLD